MDFCVKTVDTLKRPYKQQQAAVRVHSELTDWFDILKGARQPIYTQSDGGPL